MTPEKDSGRRTLRAMLWRAAREHMQMTQRDLAEALGTFPATVARWETGARDCGAVGEALAKLILSSPKRRVVRVLGLSPEDVLSEEA